VVLRVNHRIDTRHSFAGRDLNDRLRKSLGMSVCEFAAALGYSPRNGHVSVYRLENGDRRPSQQAIMLMKQLAASQRPRRRVRVPHLPKR
jgi:DNA-binding transcriptional regulator YiaG